ncbi:MAG: PD40 domain-containing protein [Actinobacteria bacterium]|nr:PD40 domain-containing protein [Actinomycetota bacterium]
MIAQPGKNVAFPRWSPDGRTLPYTSFSSSGSASDFRLHTIGADGTSPRVLRAGSEADW